MEFQFKVIGLTVENDRGEVRLDGQFHKIYHSQLFLNLPVEEMGAYRIGDKFILQTAPLESLEVVETIPLGAARDRTDEWEARQDRIREAELPLGLHPQVAMAQAFNRDVTPVEGFSDGSPLPTGGPELDSILERRVNGEGMNVKLLRRIKKHVLAEPRRLDMGVFLMTKDRAPYTYRYPKCGTVGCIAGWACVLSGVDETSPDEIETQATRLLGITGYQSCSLFYPTMNYRPQSAKMAKAVGELIDQFIANKGEL